MVQFPWTYKPPYGAGLNCQHPLIQYLTGAWTFNEFGGPTVFDNLYANNGIITGADWVATGLDFNASLTKLNAGNAAYYLESKGTIFFEYQHTTVPSQFYYFFSLDDDFSEFSFLIRPDDVQTYLYVNGDNANFTNALTYLNDGFKHTVALTWDDAANIRQLFIDGALFSTDTGAFTWDAAGIDDHDFLIGGRLTGADRYAGGIISQFLIFNKVLEDTEIATLSSNPWQIYKPEILYSYPIVSDSAYLPIIMNNYRRRRVTQCQVG